LGLLDLHHLGTSPELDEEGYGDYVLRFATRDTSAVREQFAPAILDVIDELSG